jgi:hypothetical protein
MTLGDFYAAAARPGGRGPSTSGDDLKKIRVTVNEHGEYGPVLTYTGQKFTGPDDIQLAA